MKSHKDLIYKFSPIELYEMVLIGTIKRFPPNFWNNEFSLDYAKELGEYVIKKYFKSEQDILNGYGNKFINKVHLYSALKLFNGSAYEYIDYIFPRRFKPWQFSSCPNAYWNNETAIEATKWLIEDKLKWNEHEVKQYLNYDLFCEHKLCGMLTTVYNDSVFEALNAAYPNKYLPWELNNVPRNFWKAEENVKKAFKWLIEKQLNLSEDEIEHRLTIDVITKYGLSGILRWYNGIPYEILKKIYPKINVSRIKENKERYRKNDNI